MKKILLPALGLSLILSACMPAFLQPTAAPAPQVDLNATAAVLVQASLDAQPTPTSAPSETPVVVTETSTSTAIPVTPGETQNPALLTLTATLGTGTVAASVIGTATTPAPSVTPNPVISVTPSTTEHPRFFGTLPPNLPFGFVTLVNRAKADAYISLQCTTKDGYTTIIEYPVKGTIEIKAPAGKYFYVAWVGGRQMTGNFRLDTDGELTIRLFKDKVTIGR